MTASTNGKDDFEMPSSLSKSVDFLLENAGPVIQYRLRKEILKNITEAEEENLLEQIYALPLFRLLATYVKPDGYIGSGMHSWDNWRGQVLHETPLQDGECAARLLSYYRIPKAHPFVAGFVTAMRDEEILQKEFSYIPPEIGRYENRFVGLQNGNSLMSLVYTMEAMLGYGDDYDDLKGFQQICLEGFRRVNGISSLDEITKFNPNAKRRGNCPYIEADEFYPDYYTLSMLAYTRTWRTVENIGMLADAFNHINAVMKPGSALAIRYKGKYSGPCFAFVNPIRAFRTDLVDTIAYRRLLTEIAMLGVGRKVRVLQESAENIEEAIANDGILRMRLEQPHNRRYSPMNIPYPTAYVDTRLEADYKNKNALLCDLTFWAVEFLYLLENAQSEVNQPV